MLRLVACHARSGGRSGGHGGRLGFAHQASDGGRQLSADTNPVAHAVLLDAPCSGTGVLAKRSDLRWNQSPARTTELLALQDTLLDAAARHVRPGGRLVVCEFGTPTWAPYRAAYHDVVLKHVLPTVARAVSSNPEAYLYLAESIRAWPAQPALAGRIRAAGWADVAWRNLAGGAVALHRAVRPS